MLTSLLCLWGIMNKLKREKSAKYAGVYYRFDQSGKERTYYILYRQGGRGSKLIEEPVGKSSCGMTEAKASLIRADRMRGKEMPNTERRKAEGLVKAALKDRWILSRIWEAYQDAHPEHKGRATDISRYNHYLAVLSNKTVDEIFTADIEGIRIGASTAGKKPATIRNVLALLSAVINFGVERGYCKPPDPAKLIIKKPQVDNQKTEILSDEQLARLIQALDAEEDQDAAGLIRLALVTGMRKGALIALMWDDCDFNRSIITLRGEVAKKGKTEHIPMTAAARSVLQSIHRTESPYVFPGRNGKQRTDYRRIARRVKRVAALPEDFRPLHGLRHNYASRLASTGEVDLYTIQKLLTHSSPQMTQRYAHLRDETLMKAASLTDSFLTPALEAKDD